ncbi:TIGR04255 family protein [Stenotrophomonas sp.]|uniref:TIGR04255 family protein n=1 Tax=Stenotrophomonas sp. TaxID=69392 RepID=UPI0028A1F137|nr:TIGR04255 family protein [Stenotrophomonas sp.]
MTEQMNEIVRLTEAPIVDFVCEVRFESSVSRLRDILAKSLTEAFPALIAPAAAPAPDLPFSLPPGLEIAFGGSTTQLVFPDGMNVNVSERAVGVGVAGPYRGWGELRPRIREVFSAVLSSSLIAKVSRCSVKYTNFFPGTPVDVESVLNGTLELGGRRIRSEGFQFRADFRDGDDTSIIQILNPVNVEGRSENNQGLLLDIDCIRTFSQARDIEALMAQVDAVHAHEKKLFFELLSTEARNAMGPIYA